MSNDRPWHVFVLFRDLDRHDGDRLLEAAGYFSRLSYHATEEEARNEAERKVRKLMEVNESVECAACYIEPWLGLGSSLENTPIVIRSRDLHGAGDV